MSWPYQIFALEDAQKHARRQSLDRHAAYAQLSALIPIGLIFLYRLGVFLVRRVSPYQPVAYSAVPSSPGLKHERQSPAGYWSITARRVAWWLGDDVVILGLNLGQRDQIVFGSLWSMWLVFLCFDGTGNDYLHLAKRFGIVALSQLPLQYLLILKNINPIAFAFGSSHEQLNRWHRVLGWIIYSLLLVHAGLYLNFYIQEGILSERIVRPVPALGLGSIIGMSLLGATALKTIRTYSYRVFFITHLTVAMALPPAIFFHSHHGGRQYLVEALLVFFIDLIKRKIDTVTMPSTLELIPDTNLIKIVASLPLSKLDRFRKYAGMHVYLTIPFGSRRSSHILFEFAYNPFTIASVDEKSGELTLVARRQRGPMTGALAQFAEDELTDTKVSLCMEGPYGCATWFPNLAGPEFDRILLVAGGIGSTFILPISRYILNENPTARVQVVWAVRGAADASWPLDNAENALDDNVQLFLTEDVPRELTLREAVELDSNSYLNPRQVHKRPDLQQIVDDFFRQGLEERVAVLVCGPEGMARELRSHVGVWVKKGRNVWWHNEGFTW
ncbi:ferric reductase like transmembrane component-domain-containing protein [Daldinia loculata]|nr:ferric reductase like transmembrane component-domain-containing protein [Daldinia loculata]